MTKIKTIALAAVTTMAVSVCATISAANTEIACPERIYVVNLGDRSDEAVQPGDMTVLEDYDSDGVYEGFFELPADERPALMFYTIPVDKRDENIAWGPAGGEEGLQDALYSDLQYGGYLINKTNNGEYPGCFRIINWKGGVLKISVDWNSKRGDLLSPLVTISGGNNQPAFGQLPEELYLIGNFNGYKQPFEENDDLNGAIRISRRAFPYNVCYSADVALPTGDIDMLLYADTYKGPGNAFFGGTIPVPFTLSRASADVAGEITMRAVIAGKYTSELPDDKHIMIRDWNGGTLKLELNLFSDDIHISTMDSPVEMLPEQLYKAVRTSFGTDFVEDSSLESATYYGDEDCEMWISVSDLPEMNKEDSWGTPEEVTIDMSDSSPTTSKYFTLVKGGYPIKFIPVKGNDCVATVKYHILNGYVRVMAGIRNDESGVNTVLPDNNDSSDEPVEYYTLDGVKTANPAKGLYIVRKGTKAFKTVIR